MHGVSYVCFRRSSAVETADWVSGCLRGSVSPRQGGFGFPLMRGSLYRTRPSSRPVSPLVNLRPVIDQSLAFRDVEFYGFLSSTMVLLVSLFLQMSQKHRNTQATVNTSSHENQNKVSNLYSQIQFVLILNDVIPVRQMKAFSSNTKREWCDVTNQRATVLMEPHNFLFTEIRVTLKSSLHVWFVSHRTGNAS